MGREVGIFGNLSCQLSLTSRIYFQFLLSPRALVVGNCLYVAEELSPLTCLITNYDGTSRLAQ